MRKKGRLCKNISLSYVLIIPFIAQVVLCLQIWLIVGSTSVDLASSPVKSVLLADESLTTTNNIFLENKPSSQKSTVALWEDGQPALNWPGEASASVKQQESHRNNQRILFLLSVGVAIYQFFSFKWLMSRFKELECGASAIATGDLTTKLNMQGVVEFSNLGNSLNTIAEILAYKEKETARRTAILEASNQYLYFLANIDSLTNVANRRRFDEFLENEWLKAAENGTPFSLIMCDIDCFKFYNDDYGHQEGDNCLKKVAATLEAALPQGTHLLARYGGEEFAIVLPNTHCRSAFSIAESLRLAIKQLNIPHSLSQVSPYVTISLGVSCVLAKEEIQVKTLITKADRALYQAKTEGRNRVSIYGNSCVCPENVKQNS